MRSTHSQTHGLAIEVRDLRKSYGELEAVRGVSFEVARGDVFCLLGPNGAGKTTTVEILEGYRLRTGGEVRVLGRDPAARERELRDAVGIVLQQCGVQRDLTVAELVAMYGRYHERSRPTEEVIALKAELAGRLLREQPTEAAGHVAEIEQVASGALTEVREAVSGYRRPMLDDEIAGATIALSAAGIEARIDRPTVTLDPAVEAVLAWTVREGATNVIRHSGAGRCSVTVTAGLGEAGVEVVDDGDGRDDASANGHEGNGLQGLRERVARLRGTIAAGAGSEGGYRLAVRVPTT